MVSSRAQSSTLGFENIPELGPVHSVLGANSSAGVSYDKIRTPATGKFDCPVSVIRCTIGAT